MHSTPFACFLRTLLQLCLCSCVPINDELPHRNYCLSYMGDAVPRRLFQAFADGTDCGAISGLAAQLLKRVDSRMEAVSMTLDASTA